MAGVSWAWHHWLINSYCIMFFWKSDGVAICRAVLHCWYLPCHCQLLCASCGTQENWSLKAAMWDCSVLLLAERHVTVATSLCHTEMQCECRILRWSVAVLRQQTILHQESSGMCNDHHQILIEWQNERRRRVWHIECTQSFNGGVGELEGKRPSKSAKCLSGG